MKMNDSVIMGWQFDALTKALMSLIKLETAGTDQDWGLLYLFVCLDSFSFSFQANMTLHSASLSFPSLLSLLLFLSVCGQKVEEDTMSLTSRLGRTLARSSPSVLEESNGEVGWRGVRRMERRRRRRRDKELPEGWTWIIQCMREERSSDGFSIIDTSENQPLWGSLTLKISSSSTKLSPSHRNIYTLIKHWLNNLWKSITTLQP